MGQLMPRRRFYSITHRPHVSPVALVAGIRVFHLPLRDLGTTGGLIFSGKAHREYISIRPLRVRRKGHPKLMAVASPHFARIYTLTGHVVAVEKARVTTRTAHLIYGVLRPGELVQTQSYELSTPRILREQGRPPF
jgi:hypothetical protein